jgi:hypothetical protein
MHRTAQVIMEGKGREAMSAASDNDVVAFCCKVTFFGIGIVGPVSPSLTSWQDMTALLCC